MEDVNLDVWDAITVFSLSEETSLMEATEYAIYDMNGEGFFCMAVDYSHSLFLPTDSAFNIWVFKGWDLPMKIDPFLRTKNELICINVFGDNIVLVQLIFEVLSAGVFSNALKSRILFTPHNYSHTPKPLYPSLHHNHLLRYIDRKEHCN